MMTVAVTGANGHVGNNLCRALIKQGYKVKALVNKNSSALNDLDIIKVNGSVTDIKSMAALFQDVDYVFHLAAIISIGNNSEKDILNVNVQGTENVIHLCEQNKVKRLIHFSSIHAFSLTENKMVIDENTALAGNDAAFYDQSKAQAEKLVIKAVERGLNAVILNPTSVVGPFDFIPSLVGKMILKISTNKLPFIIKGGYDWVDVRDIVNASINAITMGKSGEKYLLSGEWRSLNDIANIIIDAAGTKKPMLLPLMLAKIGLPFIRISSWMGNKTPLYTNESLKMVTKPAVEIKNEKAKKELKFNKRPTEETFKDAYHWFLKNGYIKV